MPEEIRRYFEAEAQELIDRLTLGVAALGPAGAEPAVLQDMLRAAHTLKGAAHVVGERGMATLAHEFEDGVAGYKAEPSAARAKALLALVDGISAALHGEAAAQTTALPESAPASEAQAAREAEGDAGPGFRAGQSLKTVRVDIAEAARLLEGVGESGVLVDSMRRVLERLEALEGTGTIEMRRAERAALRRRLSDDLDRLARGMGEMYQVASGLRLGSTEALLLEAGRVVRTTAAALGKEAVCVTRGERERVEMPILDALQDALLHLVRNAVAHGIGPVAARVAQGKPRAATVRVEVSREGTDVVFTCADDGRGIAIEPIRKAAVERGEMTAEEARAATDDELLKLLLRPGFSLSGRVDEVSGRGVGLDAVREAAARVRGEVSIRSVVGKGTTFTIRVPQTVFALQALEVEAGGNPYLVPLRAVEQTFALRAHHIRQVGSTQTLLMGRESMAFFWLQDAFAESADHAQDAGTCLLLRAGGSRMALGVDSIGALSEVLVHPLPEFAGVASYVAGAALGAGGTPQLVLDGRELMKFAAAGHAVASRVAPAQAVRRRRILVIDDSLTTRMLEQSILEAEGYEVELATSAEQGLVKARAGDFALFLVDVEMPGMNGFEFVAVTRADDQLKGTPAILVTSLDSAESRERGRKAGAYSYIVKGEFDQKIYLDRIRSVVGGAA